MIKKFKCIIAISLISILFSCGSKEEKIQKEFDRINEIAAKDLALKYNAITNWDSTAKYSFGYEEMFIDDKRLMLFKGKIYDIAKDDSNYVIKVINDRGDERNKFLAYITFKSKRKANLFKDNNSTTGAFVIQITKVNSSIPRIIVDAEIEENDAYAYTYLSFDEAEMLTIFKGKLIDYSLDIVYQSK